MVGQRTLTPPVGVQVPLPQPNKILLIQDDTEVNISPCSQGLYFFLLCPLLKDGLSVLLLSG